MTRHISGPVVVAFTCTVILQQVDAASDFVSNETFKKDVILHFLEEFEARGLEVTLPALRAFVNNRATIPKDSYSQTTSGNVAATVLPSMPPGPYNDTCHSCRLDGSTLACQCSGSTGNQSTSIVLTSCTNPVVVHNRNGFLHCTWADVPPPRVGAIQGPPDVRKQCRILEQTTFVALQMMPASPPIARQAAGSPDECCSACVRFNHIANATKCRAWTLTGDICTLLPTSNTAYPDARSISGYPVVADSASFCTQVAYNTWDKGDVYDRSMSPGVSCRFLAPSPNSSFPRGWEEDKFMPKNRGTAWFFFPEDRGHCDCVPSLPAGNTTCTAPEWNGQDSATLISRKPWAVFIHGGRFVFLNAIQEGYAMLASRVAKAADMGVLAVDYRTANSPPGGVAFPGGLLDVVDAMKWLLDQGASSLYLYGDSSGGTQVVELLLYLARHDPKLSSHVAGAVLFSPWVDLSDSGPGYFFSRSCDLSSSCARPVMWPSVPMAERQDGQCAALEYLPESLAMTDSIASPLQALPSELGRLPPLLVVAGGNEVLLHENFEFAHKVSKAGGAIQLEIWEGMWHDFVEHTEGCKSGFPLNEAQEALEVAGQFLKIGAQRGGCRTSEMDLACVRWHMKYNTIPPVLRSQCKPDSSHVEYV